MARERKAVADADLVGPDRQRPLRSVSWVELADRASGRVTRVHERRLARFGATLVEGCEVGE
jgi:hypothetical protein